MLENNRISGKTGIIGAMEEEVAAVRDALKSRKSTNIAGMEFIEGRLGDADVVVVKCGVGKINAGICTQTLISIFDCTRVINTGVAGALDKRLDIGDIVVSTDVVQYDFDATAVGYAKGEIPYMGLCSFPSDETMRREAVRAAMEIAPDKHVFEGRVCSGDRFVSTCEERETILADFSGLCCEMEGVGIAQACWLNNIPCVVIRAIADKSDGSRKEEYRTFMKETAENCSRITRFLVENM